MLVTPAAWGRSAGFPLPLGDLPTRADATRSRLDELIAQNSEHVAMLRQLEATHEEGEPQAPQSFAPDDLPSGDELVAELEQFLRDQGRDG